MSTHESTQMNFAPNTFAFWSHAPCLVSPSGDDLRGVPCHQHRKSGTHYIYVLTLDDQQIASIRSSPTLGAQKHFGEFRLSRSPCWAEIGGVKVRPKLALDGGPTLANFQQTGKPRRPRTPKSVWLPVHACAQHQEFVGEMLMAIVTRARENPSLRSAARLMVHSLLWHWTADGVPKDSNDLEWRGRDKLKYSFQDLPHTRKAHEKFAETRTKGLVHEHVVPRNLIVSRLLDRSPSSASAVVEFLRTYCRGVIVTREEDRTLNRDTMPRDKDIPHEAWDFDGPHNDPFARYEGAAFILYRNKEVRAGQCSYCGLDE